MKWLWRGALVVSGIVLVSLIAGVLYLRASLPRVTGTLTLAGLQGEVSVFRDQYGVAHIEASSEQDAYFALGFVHAQERLWQMEFQRRVGAGRLAEVVGEGALETDRFLRTLGVYRAAEASLPFITEASRQMLQSYVAGINAFLTENRRPLPLYGERRQLSDVQRFWAASRSRLSGGL